MYVICLHGYPGEYQVASSNYWRSVVYSLIGLLCGQRRASKESSKIKALRASSPLIRRITELLLLLLFFVSNYDIIMSIKGMFYNHNIQISLFSAQSEDFFFFFWLLIRRTICRALFLSSASRRISQSITRDATLHITDHWTTCWQYVKDQVARCSTRRFFYLLSEFN